SVKGLENSAFVLLRQSIELVLKHIYFSTHPIEFGWSLRREDYREISFQFLLEYVRKTDEWKNTGWMVSLISDLEGQFHILSRFVHMQSRTFIPYGRGRNLLATNAASIAASEGRGRILGPALRPVL